MTPAQLVLLYDEAHSESRPAPERGTGKDLMALAKMANK